ncbi:Peptidoglycan binding-like [uncultured Caudovirales phage]|uniref:Peptidoglycan binding-like n=1 Tax=uncultured Caudovirales phage TaxID=2100421 RepID=A0A6J5T6D5_9CAUD|nr:Peptidoglycan binding-like [uncultured Caudovirales phage]CAB4176747.1 Peptidoglycan binding-like [uncultured Caudovirales phage]CAB4191382.1 Peptidoglycan binding-like [uncultured Caudovirales phage]CAB4223169.1 Peptidoglycan binding-like [uncultured Caudovirales phage]CAB5220495.1 Peptidoglycan binding-like [uncultured Caudovirales phage]
MARKYTGWNQNATGKRRGTERFVQLLCQHFDGAICNNGTWAVRASRGSGNPSVHGTGRAADVSWRRMDSGKGFGNYKNALVVLDFLVDNAETLQIEELHDYYLAPHGRGWRCDRNAWKIYDKPTIGTPGGDWWHIEISEQYADDPAYYETAFKNIAAGTVPKIIVSPAISFKYPGEVVKVGSKGDSVKLIQAIVGAKADGDFGAKTSQAVKVWQKSKGVKADGVVDETCWQTMFG